MKAYIIVMTAVVTILLTIAVLGIVNYYTCFAYFLPHRPALIELAPQDILVEVHPEIIPISLNWTKGAVANQTKITFPAR